CGQGTQWPYSF
nr:immunoglobulin light chain junction region [Macaca mulatta]